MKEIPLDDLSPDEEPSISIQPELEARYLLHNAQLLLTEAQLWAVCYHSAGFSFQEIAERLHQHQLTKQTISRQAAWGLCERGWKTLLEHYQDQKQAELEQLLLLALVGVSQGVMGGDAGKHS